ncbi:hypothetical protein WA171_003056 [Blastocystis sp. BT1]
MAIVSYAFGCFLDAEYSKFICLLTFCCVVIRCDTLVLFAPFLLFLLFTNRVPFLRMVVLGVLAGVSSLLLSFIVDSYFWRKPLVPELVVLFYNTVLNKSSNWGTQPFRWYVTSVIPRLFYNCIVFIPLALFPGLSTMITSPWKSMKALWKATQNDRPDNSMKAVGSHIHRAVSTILHVDPIITSILFPLSAFVLLYSFLPHKELRFLLIMVPVVNACAAVGFARIWSQNSQNVWRLFILFIYAVMMMMLTIIFIVPSYNNYPGGYAMKKMNEIILKDIAEGVFSYPPSVHIDVYSAQTGISRYLEVPGIIYNKTEELTDFSSFNYLLTHNITEAGNMFRVIGKESCFASIDWRHAKIRLDSCIYLMKRIY